MLARPARMNHCGCSSRNAKSVAIAVARAACASPPTALAQEITAQPSRTSLSPIAGCTPNVMRPSIPVARNALAKRQPPARPPVANELLRHSQSATSSALHPSRGPFPFTSSATLSISSACAALQPGVDPREADSSGVPPGGSAATAPGLAPALSSVFTTSTCPPAAAAANARSPPTSDGTPSIPAPLSRAVSTQSACPRAEAICNAAARVEAEWRWEANREAITAAWPTFAAVARGVDVPGWLSASAAAPLSSSHCSISSRRPVAAKEAALHPLSLI
mmetsp:Transcript_18527/g.32997  ORF Transcript_18527/g.32997 Transcript_18527/m.32997 type:complete len:278 (-) Transcript_18527:427-1260(-)